jgi:hypothetical protein
MALIMAGISIPVLARAQADADAALTIPIHPRVTTILHLPDEIVHTWIVHRGEIKVARAGNKLYVRPRAGTPAGVEASLEVETKTLHRTFQLRVVRRARDASLEVVVPAAEAPFAVPATLMAPPTAVLPVVEEPAASASTVAPSPAPAEPATAADREPATTAISVPRLELFAHAAVGLGYTGLEVGGVEPATALRVHHALSLRLTGRRPGAWWAPAVTVSGEWPGGPMKYGGNSADQPRLTVSGPLLRAEVGTSAWLGTKWIPWAYAGIGMQVQLRRAEKTPAGDVSAPPVTQMKPGVVLGLGMGLQYRAGDVLLGLEFQGRYGGPDSYGSITAVWTLGYFLDQGE